jgi:hypothetical protein
MMALENQTPAPNLLGYAVLAGFGAAVLYAIFRPKKAAAETTTPSPPVTCDLETGEDFARLENWAIAKNIGVVYLPATATPPSPATSELAAGIVRSAAELVVVTGDGNFWTYVGGEPVMSEVYRQDFCAFRSAGAVSGVKWMD